MPRSREPARGKTPGARGGRGDLRRSRGARSATATDPISARKTSHLELCLRDDVEALVKSTLLEEVELVHDALPDLSLDEIDLATHFLGKRLRAPLVITGMTGGTPEAQRVNRDLAGLAEEVGIAFGVGSQRAMQRRASTTATFSVRREAPTTVVLANIGLPQARASTTSELRDLAGAIGGDGLCIHLNVAQELAQPEGDRDFRAGTETFTRLARGLKLPVIAKETGCGISRGVAQRLHRAGVRHVDLSGAGGTSWVRIERLRTPGASVIGDLFRDWGIPTAASLLEVRGLGLGVIASGGIRTGLDAARAIALGAQLVGVALPVYQAYRAGGVAGARAVVDGLVEGLRAAMLLTGSRDLAALRRTRVVLGPHLAGWAETRERATPRDRVRPGPRR